MRLLERDTKARHEGDADYSGAEDFRDCEGGQLVTCPVCSGWSPAETGMVCDMCGGDGVIWSEDDETE